MGRLKLLRLAFRNLVRNRRRTVLNMAAMTIGVFLMATGSGWVRGYFSTFYRSLIDFDTGHLQVVRRGYLEQARRFPLDLAIDGYAASEARVASLPMVAAVSGRIEFEGRLSLGAASVPLLVRAIDPPREKALTVIARAVVAGEYLDGAPGVLIGKPLAERMGVAPGDTVFLSAPDVNGAVNLIDLRVSGIYSLGYPVMDEHMALVDLASAQTMLALPDRVTRLVVRLADRVPIDRGERAVAAALAAAPVQVYPWQRFAETIVAAVRADTGSFSAMLALVFLFAVLNMVNSVAMSVRERVREIGTLRAIGMKRRQAAGLFVLEALLTALGASLVGCLLAGAAAFYLGTVGVDLSHALPADFPVPLASRFLSDYRVIDFVGASAAALATAALAAVPPSRRAARLVVVDALRDV